MRRLVFGVVLGIVALLGWRVGADSVGGPGAELLSAQAGSREKKSLSDSWLRDECRAQHRS